MQEQPYFCPNCRSNRTKFKVILQSSQAFFKDAVTGAVLEMHDSEAVVEPEPTIQCMVCGVAGNEMRFIKQAEREPRVMTPTNPVYV